MESSYRFSRSGPKAGNLASLHNGTWTHLLGNRTQNSAGRCSKLTVFPIEPFWPSHSSVRDNFYGLMRGLLGPTCCFLLPISTRWWIDVGNAVDWHGLVHELGSFAAPCDLNALFAVVKSPIRWAGQRCCSSTAVDEPHHPDSSLDRAHAADINGDKPHSFAVDREVAKIW